MLEVFIHFIISFVIEFVWLDPVIVALEFLVDCVSDFLTVNVSVSKITIITTSLKIFTLRNVLFFLRPTHTCYLWFFTVCAINFDARAPIIGLSTNSLCIFLLWLLIVLLILNASDFSFEHIGLIFVCNNLLFKTLDDFVVLFVLFWVVLLQHQQSGLILILNLLFKFLNVFFVLSDCFGMAFSHPIDVVLSFVVTIILNWTLRLVNLSFYFLKLFFEFLDLFFVLSDGLTMIVSHPIEFFFINPKIIFELNLLFIVLSLWILEFLFIRKFKSLFFL